MVIGIIIAVCAVALFLGWLYKFIKKHSDPATAKPKKPKEKKQKKEDQPLFNQSKYKINQSYMIRKELLFWKYLNTILPREYIAVPKVAVNDLLEVEGDKSTYDRIASKTIDFVIFIEKTMYPALVIDIYDKTYNDLKLQEQDPYITEVLTKMKLNFVEILVSSDFDREQTKEYIYSKLGLNNKGEKPEEKKQSTMVVDKL